MEPYFKWFWHQSWFWIVVVLHSTLIFYWYPAEYVGEVMGYVLGVILQDILIIWPFYALYRRGYLKGKKERK